MSFLYEERRRKSMSNSPFSNSSFTQDLYNESPESINSLKKSRNSLNSGEIRNYESPISSEIYRYCSSDGRNISRYASETNLHSPHLFFRSKMQRKANQEPPIGFWRHPSLDIIFKRVRRVGVSEETIKRLIVNVLAIIIIQWVKNYLNKKRFIETYLKEYNSLKVYFKYFNIFIHVVLLYNVIEATLRLVRPKDTFLDLSLTPVQRKLFGLDPHVFPSSSLNNTITPPRYVKSSPQTRQSPRPSPQQVTPYNGSSQSSCPNTETKNPSKLSPFYNELSSSSPTLMNINSSSTSLSNDEFRNRTQYIPSSRYLYKRYSLNNLPTY
ncbi:hypothetical protein PNEG_01502 [Pneumocystis murina B123]|uniref:Uncharacterized protein n=1 Tax=Pneumocystis murina (strain B123) TaxID=1069680 RepID=M7P8R1_PNEMU|nr:hypothetical protein PNEG_01502 [Pneumocystis murina B123]EMR10230.1 hypothetical protein PNEG_01502 [Pneumocystis murina B123]